MMISKQLGATILMLAAIAQLGGCVRRQNPGPDVVADNIPEDEAIRHRQWEVSRVYYANTGVIAGPTGFTFRSDPEQPAYTFALTETPIFLVNLLLIPYQVAIAPPWRKMEYRASTVPPTYTGVPPLPPEQGPDRREQSEPPPGESPAPPAPPPGRETVLPPSPGAEPSERPLAQPPSSLPRPALEPTTRPAGYP